MENRRIPIIIDVDTGTDDAICIICALHSREWLDIRGFTAVSGNVGLDRTSKNTLNLLRCLGDGSTVALGADKPLVRNANAAAIHGMSGLGDVVLPEAEPNFDPRPAYELIYEEAVKAEGRLHLLCTGPLTNLATAVQKHPDLPKLVERVTIMGGSLCGGNMSAAGEFNIWWDPEAAKIVFDAGFDLTMVGLDVTLKPQLPKYVEDFVSTLHTPDAEIVTTIMGYLRKVSALMCVNETNLHDVIALAALLHPEMMTFKDYRVDIETEGRLTRGMTVVDYLNPVKIPPNTHVAVDIDVNEFWYWFMNTLEKI